MRKIIFLVLLFEVLLTSCKARKVAQNNFLKDEVRGGSGALNDLEDVYYGIWFEGKIELREELPPVCTTIEIDDEFQKDQKWVFERFQKAAAIWDAYLKANFLAFSDGKTIRSKYIQNINNSCSSELTIVISDFEDILSKEKIVTFLHPAALTIPGKMHKEKIQNGKIWITNKKMRVNVDRMYEPNSWTVVLDPSDDFVMEHLLLHELGHIYGNEHFDKTIMDSEILPMIARFKFDPRPDDPGYIPLSIDQEYSLAEQSVENSVWEEKDFRLECNGRNCKIFKHKFGYTKEAGFFKEDTTLAYEFQYYEGRCISDFGQSPSNKLYFGSRLRIGPTPMSCPIILNRLADGSKATGVLHQNVLGKLNIRVYIERDGTHYSQVEAMNFNKVVKKGFRKY